MKMSYMQFRPKRPSVFCSIDVLFHAGLLSITHAVAVKREPTIPYRAPGSYWLSEDGKTLNWIPA